MKITKITNNALAPTVIALFGATGDLAEKKLFPALFDLYSKGLLPKKFAIVGFARRSLSDIEFRRYVESRIRKRGNHTSATEIKRFCKTLYYQQGTFEDSDAYEELDKTIAQAQKRFGQCTNKLFHLAVPPQFYSTIFDRLASSGLMKPCGAETGWARVLVEKPFGRDSKTAQALDQQLGHLFKEEQIFRIDHYLGKEMVQNIVAFRFANSIFEAVWSAKHIAEIAVTMHETIDVEGRGEFYDGVGALRDVGANHILQMLALITMDRPKDLSARSIRKARATVVTKLKTLSGKKIATQTARGQYKGFTQIKGVDKHSTTETFFRIHTEIDTPRWRGVPIVLESGKALAHQDSSITIRFKSGGPCLCAPGEHKGSHESNVLKFVISPDEKIEVQFMAKTPGFEYKLQPRIFHFAHHTAGALAEYEPDAYEKVIYDCIHGDQTLFTSTQEVEAAWKFITPIVRAWSGGVGTMQRYKVGAKPETI